METPSSESPGFSASIPSIFRCQNEGPNKNPLTFHYIGCLIGILIMVYWNPESPHSWVVIISSPTNPRNNRLGPFNHGPQSQVLFPPQLTVNLPNAVGSSLTKRRLRLSDVGWISLQLPPLASSRGEFRTGGVERCGKNKAIPWVVPPRSNSHHQDYYIFSRGSL